MAQRRFVALLIALTIGSVVIPAGEVWAHAKLIRSDPAAGSTVKTPPKVVRLWFRLSGSEELDPTRSTVTVLDIRNRRVDDGKGGVDLHDLDRRSMLAKLKPLGPGRYTVKWKAVSSEDLNIAQGSYRFTVASPVQGAALPPLTIVAPTNGATVNSPVVVVFATPADLSTMTLGSQAMEMDGMKATPHLHIDLDKRVTMPTMKQLAKVGSRRYQFNLGKATTGKHVIRVYWAHPKTHVPIDAVRTVSITVR